MHTCNDRAMGFYERLGMERCTWWERGDGEGSQWVRMGDGRSLYEPRHGYQIMRAEAGGLEGALN